MKQQQHQHHNKAAANNDLEQWQNDDHHSYRLNADVEQYAEQEDHHIDQYIGMSKYNKYKDLAAGKEKLVIAAAPQSLKNCNDELNNCKRINRERLCKLEFYKTYCCLTCHGYY